jgi:hypothetical protein
MDQDRKYLNILAGFHLVVAVIIALVSCFPIIHLAVGIGLLRDFGSIPPDPEVPDSFDLTFRLVPILFITIATSLILGGWSFAAAVAFSGVSLFQRRRHTYSLVMGGVECMFVPIGTVLGVFTILLLTRPTVRALYEGAPGDLGGSPASA